MNVSKRTLVYFVLLVCALSIGGGVVIDIDHTWVRDRPLHYLIRDSPVCLGLWSLMGGVIITALRVGWGLIDE